MRYGQAGRSGTQPATIMHVGQAACYRSMSGGFVLQRVIIKATDESVKVVLVGDASREFTFATPGALTGADLREVLVACGISVRYSYRDQTGER